MAKIKKRKLVWKPSKSAQVVGYKLYWSEEGPVGYHSASAKLGNVNEVVLPDDVEGFDQVKGPVELGITAMDELGNESDVVVLKTPYQFNVPQAPSDLWMETLQQYHTTPGTSETPHEQEASIRLVENTASPNPAAGNPDVQQASMTSSPGEGVTDAGGGQAQKL
jgi:hypothetical protein